jgi:hypothetical protein
MKSQIAGLLLLISILIGCQKQVPTDINSASGSYRMYYLIESGFTCTKNGQTITTYKGKIGYDQTNFLVFGNGCTTSAQKFPKKTAGFTVTDTQITYQGNTYIYMANAPDFDDE